MMMNNNTMSSMQQPVASSNANTSAFQELNNLFSHILQTWNLHPTHFGFPQFEQFMAQLPAIYYHLITYQRLERLRQQQMAMNMSQNLLELTEKNVARHQAQQQQQEQDKPDHQEPSVEVAKPEQPKMAIPSSCESAKANPFSSALPSKHKKQRKVKVLAPIDEAKPSPSPPMSPVPSLSPSPSYSFASSSSSSSNNSSMNALAAAFVPTKTYKKLQVFKPKHAARAKLNIYIPKHMTKQLLPKIRESFPNTNTLYYYLDISTALQINDSQMTVWQTEENEKIVLINYDLHTVDTNQLLFAVVTPNDEHKVEANTEKWLWKIDCFMTEQQIVDKYQFEPEDLPKSSRSMTTGIFDQLQEQMSHLEGINDLTLLSEYKWIENEIKQIGSSQKSKKGRKLPVVKVTMDIEEWIHCCQSSWSYLPAIPIIVYENRDINKHWIEWVKMVYVPTEDCYVGVSFKFDAQTKAWQIESICLDKGDMHNKHRLISLQSIEGMTRFDGMSYDSCFDGFNTRVTELEWA